jgi:UDP-glucose 4-epimerase
LSCFVIGGAGFIGIHVTRQLVNSGRDVVVLGRSIEPRRKLPQSARYIRGDYGNREEIRDIISGADEIINLAYSTVPKTSFDNPVFDIVSNLPQSVGLFDEAIGRNLKKLVVISSGGTVYGIAESTPINEDHPTNPISPYGITKLTIEKYARMYKELFGLPIVIARPGNAYGAEQEPLGAQGFIATAIRCILSGMTIDIFGAQGTVRDYLHVSDIASGIVAILNFGKPGEAYNVGSGIGHNNFDVLDIIKPKAEQAGYSILSRLVAGRNFDVPVNVLQNNKLRTVSGWQPIIPFEQGLKQTWEAVLETSHS